MECNIVELLECRGWSSHKVELDLHLSFMLLIYYGTS